MPNIADADAIKLGTQIVGAVYFGATKVWPSVALAPFTVNATSSVSGTCSTPANATGAQDGVWTTDTGGAAWNHTWGFTLPGTTFGTSHTITALVRSQPGQSGLPDVDAMTVLVDGVDAGASITGLGTINGEITLTANFTAQPSSTVEVQINALAAGGKPTNRGAVQVDFLEWSGDAA